VYLHYQAVVVGWGEYRIPCLTDTLFHLFTKKEESCISAENQVRKRRLNEDDLHGLSLQEGNPP
jgi:hypothetical protein